MRAMTPNKEVVTFRVEGKSPSSRILPNEIKGTSTYIVTVPSSAINSRLKLLRL